METHKQKFKKLFDLTDTDQDNLVTLNELILMIQTDQVNWSDQTRLKNILEKGNLNKNSKFRFDELYQYYLMEKLKPVFNSADTDKDNFVTINEIVYVLNIINSQEFSQLSEVFKNSNLDKTQKLSLQDMVKYWP